VLEVNAELAQLDDCRSPPTDRVGRERQRERHPVLFAERLARAQDAVVTGVDSTVRPTASSRRMNSRTSFLIPGPGRPGRDQLASFGATAGRGDRRRPLLQPGVPSIRSVTTAGMALSGFDREAW
jgi:hypothetical protein